MESMQMTNKPLRIFVGYDHRQPISYHVLEHSIMLTTSKPVSVIPVMLNTLPFKRVGLTPFTFSRFLVPWLCDFEGWALFLDIDILLLDDVSKLFEVADDRYSVMVSKNRIEYEWASVMLFNCAKNKILTPEYCETANGLHSIKWCDPSEIGELPSEWNHLVGYDKPRNDAKLVHYTQGVPCFPETEDSEHAGIWHQVQQGINFAWPWVELMGNSKHALPDKQGRPVPRYKMEPPK